MPEELVRTVGRYGILREIGRGGMGVVFLARQLDLDRHVALKEMAALHAAEPMIARRFVRESRLAGSLTHANVVTVFDYFEHEGTRVHRDGVGRARVAAAVRRADDAWRRSAACSRACWPGSARPSSARSCTATSSPRT